MSQLEVAVVVSLGSDRRYHTCEELGKMCGASPKQIREAIQSLVARGCRIDEVPGEGFRLNGASVVLNGSDVRSNLATKIIGREVFAFGRVGSTNDVATALAKGGAPDGCMVIAEEQTRGRGRLGRKWYSPSQSGLWFSLVLRPEVRAEISTTVSLATALGVAAALEDRYSIPARIKWPNDVVVHRRKICGILTEAEFLGGELNFVVVGVGINLLGEESDFPRELRGIATSLRMESGGQISRSEVLAALTAGIEKMYLRLRVQGFSGIRRELLGKSSLIGRVVRVQTGVGAIEGTATDIDEVGALVLRDASGSLQRVLAGEVVELA
jgi:BirA family biotin operon repressor/biotin-[acetyl-CoA-carboxylase] ligase